MNNSSNNNIPSLIWDIVQSLNKVSIQKGLMEVEMNCMIQVVSKRVFKISYVVSYRISIHETVIQVHAVQYMCAIMTTMNTCCNTNSTYQ